MNRPAEAAATHTQYLTYERTRQIAMAALVTALISASAFVQIPLGAVPVTLQVFFVVLAALLLTPSWAAASMVAYVAIGAVGIPVFAGQTGGVGVIAGATGGYLVGFVLGALLGSIAKDSAKRLGLPPVAGDVIAAAVVIVAIYAVGVAQLAIVLGLAPKAALMAGAVPFIVPDALKAAVAVVIAGAVRAAVRRA